MGLNLPGTPFGVQLDEAQSMTSAGQVVYFCHQGTLSLLDLVTRRLVPVAGEREQLGRPAEFALGFERMAWPSACKSGHCGRNDVLANRKPDHRPPGHSRLNLLRCFHRGTTESFRATRAR